MVLSRFASKGAANSFMQAIGTCSELLVALLQSHGIVGIYDEERSIVTIPDHPGFMMALEISGSPNEKRMVAMDATFVMAPGKFIKETLAGYGETESEAVMDAQKQFVGCVLRVSCLACFARSSM